MSTSSPPELDAVILGGGPAGLAAALALGRARRRVLLVDGGPRRNERAHELHNFVTRDGTTPDDFRRAARAELARYETVECREERALELSGERGCFLVRTESREIRTRRVLLALGRVDELPAIPGFADLWGHSIAQCPYCHGWEAQDRRFGYLASDLRTLLFPIVLRSWTDSVTVYCSPGLSIPRETLERFERNAIAVETAAIAGLEGRGGELDTIVLSDGRRRGCDFLFAHPPQRHVPLIESLGLALDETGSVALDPFTRETSIPGIYAAGDLTTKLQAAIAAAASGTQAAAMLNHDLALEFAP